MSPLPPPTTPLNQHSLRALEEWLHGLGAEPIDGDRCRWGSGEWRPVDAGPVGVGHRTAVIFRMSGEDHSETAESLPLWLQPLGGRTVAIPAPLLADPPEPADRSENVHVHAPEGAVILWHLWHAIPKDLWPLAWDESLALAQAHVLHWPHSLPTASPSAISGHPNGPSGVVGSGGSEGTQG